MKQISPLSGWVALGVAMLAAMLAALALWTSKAAVEAGDAAEATLEATLAYSDTLGDLKDAVLDAETGQRGYLLTGERKYLEPYTAAVGRVEGFDYPTAPNLESGDGAGRDEELERLVKLKMEELALTIAQFDAGNPTAALATVKTDRGQELMQEIRELVAQRQAGAGRTARDARARVMVLERRGGRVQLLMLAVIGLMIIGAVSTLLQARRLARARLGKAEAEDMRERMEVLAHELDHRMKNLFAVSQGLISQSARGRGEDVAEFAGEVGGRLRALSQAYSVTRELDAVRSMPKSEIVDKVVRAQLLDTHRFHMEGDDGAVVEKAVTPLALILHEWTTNALKYGAWRPGDEGEPPLDTEVRLSWSRAEDGTYEFLWDERHRRDGTDIPERQGYGSRLVKMCASQLGGLVDYDWHDEGVRIRLSASPERLGVA